MALIQPTYIQIDEFSRLVGWYIINGGDTLGPAQAWAYPIGSWQLTGYAQNGNINNPNVPVMADRAIEMHGSNDGTCFGLMWTMAADVNGMASRMADPIRNGNDEQRFIWLQPKVLGSVNPMGGDCSLMLFQARWFGPRS